MLHRSQILTIRNPEEANNGIEEPSEHNYYRTPNHTWSGLKGSLFVQNWRQYHHYYQQVTAVLTHKGLMHLVRDGCNSVTPRIPSKHAECIKRLSQPSLHLQLWKQTNLPAHKKICHPFIVFFSLKIEWMSSFVLRQGSLFFERKRVRFRGFLMRKDQVWYSWLRSGCNCLVDSSDLCRSRWEGSWRHGSLFSFHHGSQGWVLDNWGQMKSVVLFSPGLKDMFHNCCP